jgi:hypothetical protein
MSRKAFEKIAAGIKDALQVARGTASPAHLRTPAARATMTAEESEDLVDDRDHAAAMLGNQDGTVPLVDDKDVDTYLAAPTPLSFWRARRGLRQGDPAGQ